MLPNPSILGIELQWYSLWQWIAIMITLCFSFWYTRFISPSKIIPLHRIIIILTIIVLGYTGARLLSILDYLTETGQLLSIDNILQSPKGGRLRWYGSLLFFIFGLPVIAKFFKIKALPILFDELALKICLFTAIIKQACFFSGDGCYGIYTNLPWGMYFPYGAAPNILPVHPTPLYDTLFHLAFFIFLYLWNTSNRKQYEGQLAILFFAGTSIFNIAIEFIRINPVIFLGFTLSQLTYMLILTFSGLYYCYLMRTKSEVLEYG